MTETTAGSLFAAIKAAGTHPGPRCTIAVILDDLTPEDAADLRVALTDPTIKATHIARVLKDRGYQITPDTIRRHIKHDCGCS